MVQMQWLQLLVSLAGIIGGALVIIAQYRKVSLERAQQANLVWADAVNALKAHVEALLLVQRDKEGEIGELRQEIQGLKLLAAQEQKERELFERERAQWTRRNARLFELVNNYRARLAVHGELVPEPDGGT